jgi:hypothetical protein
MNVSDIDTALRIGRYATPAGEALDLCQFAGAVHATLTALANRAGWWQAAVLRTAAGLISRWQREHCGVVQP